MALTDRLVAERQRGRLEPVEEAARFDQLRYHARLVLMALVLRHHPLRALGCRHVDGFLPRLATPED